MRTSILRTSLLGNSLLAGVLALAMTGCMSDLGGDCTGERCDTGSDGPTNTDCDNPTELKTSLTISSDADFAKVPAGCWSLNANLTIQGSAITSLAKLGDLVDVNDLQLIDTGLTSIDSKQHIKVYGNVLVSGNTKLAALANMDIAKWDGEVSGGTWTVAYTVRNNALLASLDAFKYIKTVDGDLRFTDNAKLGTIELDELTKVGGAVVISNTGAPAINLPALTNIGRVEISANTTLTSIHGFGASSILGDFILRGNTALTQLGTMSSLASIGGSLVVDDNDALADLTGLTTSMHAIYGAVTITNNAHLSALGQLSHLSSIGTTTITQNPSLPNCKAVEVDRCVPNSTVTISGNQTQNNCQSWCGL